MFKRCSRSLFQLLKMESKKSLIILIVGGILSFLLGEFVGRLSVGISKVYSRNSWSTINLEDFGIWLDKEKESTRFDPDDYLFATNVIKDPVTGKQRLKEPKEGVAQAWSWPKVEEFAKEWSKKNKDERIYLITPTVRSPTQLADLTRMAQALLPVAPIVTWLIFEDSNKTRKDHPRHVEFLWEELFPFMRMSDMEIFIDWTSPRPPDAKVFQNPRGVEGRNDGLKWVRREAKGKGVVYFADDDNTYDPDLFRQIIMNADKVTAWPVAYITEWTMLSTPVVNFTTGKVFDFHDGFKVNRLFPMDFAGFAIPVRLFVKNPNVTVSYLAGYEETTLLRKLGVRLQDLTPLANGATEVLAFHTRTRSTVHNITTAALQKFENEVAQDLGGTNILYLRKKYDFILSVPSSTYRRLITTKKPSNSTLRSAVSTKQPTTLRSAVSTKQPTTLRTAVSTKQPTTLQAVIKNVVTTKQPTTLQAVIKNVVTTKQPTTLQAVIKNVVTTKQPTTLKNVVSTKQPTTLKNDAPTEQPTTFRNVASKKQSTTLKTVIRTKQSTTLKTVISTKQPTTLKAVIKNVVTTKQPTTLKSVAPTEQPTTFRNVASKKQSTTLKTIVSTKQPEPTTIKTTPKKQATAKVQQVPTINPKITNSETENETPVIPKYNFKSPTDVKPLAVSKSTNKPPKDIEPPSPSNNVKSLKDIETPAYRNTSTETETGKKNM